MSVFFVKFVEPYISDLHFTIYNHNLRGETTRNKIREEKISQLSHHRLSTPFSLLVAGSTFAILETESSPPPTWERLGSLWAGPIWGAISGFH